MASIEEIKYAIPPQPRQLRLDTIARCNARCLSCHMCMTQRNGEMPMDLINQILTDVSRWNSPLTEIVPVNYGEFFLREDWYIILNKIAHSLPYTQIVIPSNGSLINSDVIAQLSKIPTIKIINFSINAYFEETYKNFTGLPSDNLTKIRRTVAQLRLLRPDISIWTSMVFDPVYQTDLERDLFLNQWISFSSPQILPAASAGRPDKRPIYPVKLPCRSLFSDIVVGYDRKISSCCFDANFTLDLGYYKGNLLKNWKSKKLGILRKAHNEGRRKEYELCKICTFA